MRWYPVPYVAEVVVNARWLTALVLFAGLSPALWAEETAAQRGKKNLLTKAYNPPTTALFTFTRVRGTSEAGGMAVFLLGHREPDLSLRFIRKDLDLKDDLVEDAPAWWLLKKKKRMYYTGGTDQRSVRSIMQFMMSPV